MSWSLTLPSSLSFTSDCGYQYRFHHHSGYHYHFHDCCHYHEIIPSVTVIIVVIMIITISVTGITINCIIITTPNDIECYHYRYYRYHRYCLNSIVTTEIVIVTFIDTRSIMITILGIVSMTTVPFLGLIMPQSCKIIHTQLWLRLLRLLLIVVFMMMTTTTVAWRILERR